MTITHTPNAGADCKCGPCTEAVDRLYLSKVHQYTVDPSFDGHVLGYLRLMVEEYRHQAKVLPTAIERKVAEAKAYAYDDAVRVLADADDAAYRFVTEAMRPQR